MPCTKSVRTPLSEHEKLFNAGPRSRASVLECAWCCTSIKIGGIPAGFILCFVDSLTRLRRAEKPFLQSRLPGSFREFFRNLLNRAIGYLLSIFDDQDVR